MKTMRQAARGRRQKATWAGGHGGGAWEQERERTERLRRYNRIAHVVLSEELRIIDYEERCTQREQLEADMKAEREASTIGLGDLQRSSVKLRLFRPTTPLGWLKGWSPVPSPARRGSEMHRSLSVPPMRRSSSSAFDMVSEADSEPPLTSPRKYSLERRYSIGTPVGAVARAVARNRPHSARSRSRSVSRSFIQGWTPPPPSSLSVEEHVPNSL